MWESQIESLNSGCIQKISIFSQTRRVTYSEVIQLWQQAETFRSFFISLLASAPFSAYFWETPPITHSTVNQEFEFVLVDSPQLTKVEPELSSFKEYFESTSEDVITFPNLNQDALLVVPCPIAKSSAYPHLATFVREAPKSQQHALWQTVGSVLEQNLNDRSTWVSTSGLGVYWLHVRLDSYPKYYSFNPYKIAG
ncbi:hypothetical protein STA3757_40750 [Stanieria sp. NIES-3757]|nr:hypothetical protein STA3757_40750 [Stanieria sp. NIES-3757]